MRLETLESMQLEYFARYMDSVVRSCREKYLEAARLMEVENEAVEKVREMIFAGPIDLYYLLPAYSALCARYNRRFFSPQENLFKNPKEEQDARFCRYFWHRLVPQLLRSNDIVRNVLRAVQGLPCASPKEAGSSLKQAAIVCDLPEFEELRYNPAGVL